MAKSDNHSQQLLERVQKIESTSFDALPVGAVLAFNSQVCPEGDIWQPFVQASGRFVLGAGDGSGLTPRKLGDAGGAEMHRLTIEELPSHSHKGKHPKWGELNFKGGGNSQAWHKVKEFTEYDTKNIGGSQPHNNMPPFVTLLYCQKVK